MRVRYKKIKAPKPMQLEPVTSSHIAAIGYRPDLHLLHVQFKDGSVFAFPSTTPAEHRLLMGAPSKGKALRALEKDGVRIDRVISGAEVPPLIPKPMPLNSVEDDDCCAGKLRRALFAGLKADSWTCPKCGCDWKPRQVGPLRHWEPHEAVSVFRARAR